MLAGVAAWLTAIIAQLRMNGNNNIMMLQQQQQQSQPVSALRGGDMMGSSPGHRIDGLKIASPSEALTVIVLAPHHNKRLYAPELLNARASKDNQVTNAEDVVAEHPLLGYIVPVQASADNAEPLATEIKVEQQQQQQQHRPDSTEAVKNVFTETSAGRVFSRGLWTKGFEKLYAHAADTTASLALGYFSLRFGGKTPALLATLVTAAGTLSVASAATTSCLSAGRTAADIGSSGTTSVPGDRTDEATLALFSWLANIGAATALAWIVRVSALWVLATLAFWARRRSRSRKNGASVSPNNPPTAAGTAAAPAMPPAGTPPAAAAAMPAAAVATPPAAAAMPVAAAAMPAPAPGAPPAAAVPAPTTPTAPTAAATPAAAHAPAPAPAPAPAAAAFTSSTESTASNPADSHVATPGSPAPARTGQAQTVANAPAAPEPEPRVGRGLRRAMQRLGRGITLASMATKVKEAASEVDVDEVVSSVREFFSDVADALGDVMDVVGGSRGGGRFVGLLALTFASAIKLGNLESNMLVELPSGFRCIWNNLPHLVQFAAIFLMMVLLYGVNRAFDKADDAMSTRLSRATAALLHERRHHHAPRPRHWLTTGDKVESAAVRDAAFLHERGHHAQRLGTREGTPALPPRVL